MTFAADTAVEDRGGGTFAARVPDGWHVVGNAHGGVLLSIAGRALAAATGQPDPVTVTAHYLRAGRTGPVTVQTDVVRSGRRFATGTATVGPSDQPWVSVLGTFGDLGEDSTDGSAPMWIDGAPPDLPDPADCSRAVPGDPFPPQFMGRIDLRLHPDDARFFEGVRSGRAHLRGWVALPDDEPLDTIAMLSVVDIFPPTVFNLDLPLGWVPTLELTAHVRARPAPGRIAAEVRTRFVTGGLLEVDGVYWDSTGTLVAQSRQLALVPRG